MNCQDFESLAGDLTRGVPVEARAREEARAHEADCPRCAARLADERALADGLRGLAARASAAAAPPRVEANLLAAFRAQAAARAVAATPHADEASAPGRTAVPNAEKVLPFARPSGPNARPAEPKRWSWMKTAVASATAAAAAVTLFVLVAPQKSSTPRPTETAGTQQADRALTPPPSPQTGATASASVDSARKDETQAGETHITRPTYPTRAAGALAPRRLTTTPAAFRHDSGRATRPARAADARGEEIATSFIPLTQDAALAAAEGGQVVRVELPRTALQRFGLPMNVERVGERVKADVLLGHDGVARAIRFVR